MGGFKSWVVLPAFCVTLVVLVPITLCSDQGLTGSTVVNFDKLFPQSPLHIVLESFMRIQHELLWHAARDKVDDAESELLIDLVVGRLYHVRSCTQEIIASNLVVQEEDLMYLFSLLETIMETYHKLMQEKLPAHGKHALALLSDIKTLLETLTR